MLRRIGVCLAACVARDKIQHKHVQKRATRRIRRVVELVLCPTLSHTCGFLGACVCVYIYWLNGRIYMCMCIYYKYIHTESSCVWLDVSQGVHMCLDIYLFIYTQSLHVYSYVYAHRVHMCGYIFTYIHPRFICVCVYITYVHTEFTCACVYNYTYTHKVCICMCIF